MNHIFLWNIIERLGASGWRCALEGTRPLMGIFTRSLLVVFGRLSTGHCLAVYFMSKQIIQIYRKNGPIFLGKYLKQVKILTMQYLSGEPQPAQTGVFVSLTRTGLPRFISPHYRKLIAAREPGPIRVVLTVCALHRILRSPTRGRTEMGSASSTLNKTSSDSDPRFQALRFFLESQAVALTSRYTRRLCQFPMELGYRCRPFFTSGPNTSRLSLLSKRVKGVLDSTLNKTKFRMSIYHTLPLDGLALETLLPSGIINFCSSILAPFRVAFAGDSSPVTRDFQGALNFTRYLKMLAIAGHQVWDVRKRNPPGEIGRLGLKVEGAGKLRIFAIASPVLQWLVRPLHDWAMTVLKSIVTDGTFDQLAPLRRLKGKKDLFSFDLKSATDTLPSVLSSSLLMGYFGEDFGYAWERIMRFTSFERAPKLQFPGKTNVMMFLVGQPLGYYSSWPVFTLTHHFLIWVAAEMVYPGRRFLDYAVLGDDVVIADTRVATEYSALIGVAQATISKEKSLESHQGVCEFASRFMMNCGELDLSPVSVACLRLCRSFAAPAIFTSLGVTNPITLNRLRGGGYRTCTNLSWRKLSRRWRRFWLAVRCPSGPLSLPVDIWLAYPDKGVLTCYEVGLVREFLLKKVKPRPLNEDSFQRARLFWEDFEWLYEGTISNVLHSYYTNLAEYARLSADPLVSLSDILKFQQVSSKLERDLQDPVLPKYGILFQAWDFIRVQDPVKVLDSSANLRPSPVDDDSSVRSYSLSD